MRRVLVTGGCGFIGSNLVHELLAHSAIVEVVDDMSNGHLEFLLEDNSYVGVPTVRVVPINLLRAYEEQNIEDRNSPPDVLVIDGDFAHADVLTRIRDGHYDVIFHLAANPRVTYSVNNPTETTEQNVLKTVGLFEVASKSNTRVVFSSSASVYGDSDELPTTEEANKVQNSPYGLQKFVGERFGEMFARLYGLDIVSLRYFNVYGPRQYGGSAYSTAVCAWCDKIKGGLSLRSDGDGTQSRDLVYVGDVVAANILAAGREEPFRGEAYNVASGEVHTNNEILEMFLNKFSNVTVESAPWRLGDVMHTQASTTAATDALGFKAQTGLKEGLALTWKWWGLDGGL